MTTTAALTRYHVTVGQPQSNGLITMGGRLTIDATSKEEAAELALDRKVEIVKAYNAKYGVSHDMAGVSWARQNEDRAAYAVAKVRKAPTKR